MTWRRGQFFSLFTERELYLMISRDLYDRDTRRVYQAVVRTGPRASQMYLSFVQWLGVINAERRREIEAKMHECTILPPDVATADSGVLQ